MGNKKPPALRAGGDVDGRALRPGLRRGATGGLLLTALRLTPKLEMRGLDGFVVPSRPEAGDTPAEYIDPAHGHPRKNGGHLIPHAGAQTGIPEAELGFQTALHVRHRATSHLGCREARDCASSLWDYEYRDRRNSTQDAKIRSPSHSLSARCKQMLAGTTQGRDRALR